MKSLNDAYASYDRAEINWTVFVSICFFHIGEILERVFHVPAREKIEIVAEFYPRFCNVVARYEEQGSTFEAYLKVSLRFFYRTRVERDQEIYSKELLVSDFEEEPYSASPADSEPIWVEEQGTLIDPLPLLCDTRQRDTVRRQLLIAFCKNFPLLTDRDITRLSRVLRIPEGIVDGLTVYTHIKKRHYLDLRSEYRRSRDYHYSRIIAIQTTVSATVSEKELSKLRKQEDYHRRRFHHYRQRIEKQNIRLSNREVGELLGIPKGSVDSAMANLNRRLELLQSNQYSNAYADRSRFKQPAQISRDTRDHHRLRSIGRGRSSQGP